MSPRFWFTYEKRRHTVLAVMIGVPIAVGIGLLFVYTILATLPLAVLVAFSVFDLWLKPRLLKGGLQRQLKAHDNDVIHAGAAVKAARELLGKGHDYISDQVVQRAKEISKRGDDYFMFLIKSFADTPDLGSTRKEE